MDSPLEQRVILSVLQLLLLASQNHPDTTHTKDNSLCTETQQNQARETACVQKAQQSCTHTEASHSATDKNIPVDSTTQKTRENDAEAAVSACVYHADSPHTATTLILHGKVVAFVDSGCAAAVLEPWRYACVHDALAGTALLLCAKVKLFKEFVRAVDKIRYRAYVHA